MVVASVDSSLAQHILPRLWPLPPRGFLQRGLFQCNNLGIEKHYFMHLVSKRAQAHCGHIHSVQFWRCWRCRHRVSWCTNRMAFFRLYSSTWPNKTSAATAASVTLCVLSVRRGRRKCKWKPWSGVGGGKKPFCLRVMKHGGGIASITGIARRVYNRAGFEPI